MKRNQVKYCFCLAGFMFASSHSAHAAPPEVRGTTWVPNAALSDEFSGSDLDESKWMPSHPYWSGKKRSPFSSQNVSVQGGFLRLKMTSAGGGRRDEHNPSDMLASCVSSKKPMALYGYYEVRMKASSLTSSSSFWLQGKHTEVDVTEAVGMPIKNPEHRFMMHSGTGFFPSGKFPPIGTTTAWYRMQSPADSWHTYGVWWRDSRHLSFYLDGEKVGEQIAPGDFNQPMYLFLDTEYFAFEGTPSPTDLQDGARNTMYVDWIRSWVPRPKR